MRVTSGADVSSWLATQTCACGARTFATDPVLAEQDGTLVLRFAGCSVCHEPPHFDVRLPEPLERAVAGKHVLDPDVIALIAPFVATSFPAYAAAPPEAINTSSLDLGPWRVVEWLRGSFAYGQARCMRADGARALATFTRMPAQPLERIATSLADGARGVTPILDVRSAGDYAVLFEAEPSGTPLSTAMFPLALDLALLVFGKLLEIASDAAAAGDVLQGLRPELVYLGRGATLIAAPRAERFAMLSPSMRDDTTSPFEVLYCGPETVQGGKVSPAYDVFSCCAMFLFLLTRQPPFPGASVMHQVASMLKGPPALPAALDPRTAELVRAGLDPDPKRRPSARDLAASVVVS